MKKQKPPTVNVKKTKSEGSASSSKKLVDISKYRVKVKGSAKQKEKPKTPSKSSVASSKSKSKVKPSRAASSKAKVAAASSSKSKVKPLDAPSKAKVSVVPTPQPNLKPLEAKSETADEKQSPRNSGENLTFGINSEIPQAPLIYGEIPTSIDASRLKRSMKQIFIKKNREYPILPKVINPLKYHMYISPQLDLFSFMAVVLIVFELRPGRGPVDKIVMNSAWQQITSIFLYKTEEQALSASEKEEDPSKSLKFNSSNTTEILEIFLTEIIRTGTCVLKINYVGTITDQMKGFHYSRYINSASETNTFLTKCAPCDARRVVPCFDEPEYKAVFHLTLVVPKNKMVVANMPEKETKNVRMKNQKGFKEVLFNETPRMSTFQIAFAVGDFNFIRATTSKGVKVRVLIPYHLKKRQGKFALNIAVKSMDFMETILKVPYQSTKLDFVPIGVANFTSQCSLGLAIFHNEAIMTLARGRTISQSPRILYQNISLLISRAVAEQWVGNAVTMEWWSDVWVNMGLATLLQYLCVHALIEEFQIMNQFCTLVTENALRMDIYKSSQPLRYNLKDPPDIEESYDDMTADKGAAVLRMLYDYVGAKVFEKGLSTFIQANDKTNSSATKFWFALAKAGESIPIDSIMLKWMTVKGFPLIKVISVVEQRPSTSTIIKASQQPFAAISGSSGNSQVWEIPLRVVCSNDPYKVAQTEIVKESQFTIRIEQSNITWVLLNPGRTGYFRVSYSKPLMGKISHAISLKKISPLDRLVVLQDLFAMAISGYSSVVDVLKLLLYYVNEDDYHVWRGIDDVVHELDRYISYSSKDAYERFQQYILRVYKNVVKSYGKEAFDKKYPRIHEYTRFLRSHFSCLIPQTDPSHKGHLELLLFGLVIKRLVVFGDEDFITWAKDIFISAANDECDVHPDIYPAVSIGFIQWKDNEENLHLLFRAYRQAKSMIEKEIIMEGFSCFRANTQIRKILQFAISSNVDINHTPLIMSKCALTKLGRHMSWYFFKEHVAHFSRVYYQNEQLLKPLFRHVVPYFMTENRLVDVQKFFQQHGFQGLHRTVEETLDCIRRNIAWAKRDLGEVNKYLASLNSKKDFVENDM